MDATIPKIPAAESASQTMSQSEVERLLALVGDGDNAQVDITPVAIETKSGSSMAVRHDFPQVTSFSAGEMRKLRMRCEDYVRSLAARMSVHLRLECATQMTKLETVRFQPFVETLSNPTHLTLFKLDPLAGVCLLDIPPRLGLCVIDRELGGLAVCQDEARDLTPMETKLIARVVDLILGEWSGVWSDTLQLRAVVLRHETCGRFLETHPPDAMMLIFGIEVRFAQTTELLQIAFPHSMLEPLIVKLRTEIERIEKPKPTQPAVIAWNSAMDDVPIRVVAQWNGLELTAREILALKPGDTLPLRLAANSPVEVSLESIPRFSGQLGACGPQLAVKITGSIGS